MYIFGLILSVSALAAPSVMSVTAKQRYPWNGKVDIAFSVSGIDGTTNGLKFAVAAVMPDSGNVRNVSHVWTVRGGAASDDLQVHTNGAYQLLWDAYADLGEVNFSNMVVRVNITDVHERVQLWAGGPYWARTNIGAEEPEDYGLYFWWGDTVGYRRENKVWVASDGLSQKFSFSSGNTPTYYKNTSALQSEGWTTSSGVLAPEHDAAHVHWGGDWRMPTEDELSALCNNCDWTWTTRNGVNGYVVRGRGDFSSQSIFLPAAGDGYGTTREYAGSIGNYWSSVPYSGSTYGDYSWYLDFSGRRVTDDYDNRHWGFPVRPVQGFVDSALAVTTDHVGDSTPFPLDTCMGVRPARADEPLAYSTAWNGAGACSITLDGEPLLSNATGTGDYVWNAGAASGGLHTLTLADGVETLTATFAVNRPDVSNLTAKQRYPWNGKVDIACTVAGIDGTTNGLKFAVAAVMPDSDDVRIVSYVQVVRGGAASDDLQVHTNGAYQLLWDAYADLGEVNFSNMVVRVTLEKERERVQLWAGGPYWATTNIGAEEPEDYGLYFWWGDTVGYRLEGNAWVASDGSTQNFSFGSGNTPTYGKSPSTLQSEGWVVSKDGTYVLAPEHDAAHVHWGGNWRMPTKDELSALNSNCDWTWTTRNGVNGYVVRGRDNYASASIFLPAAGHGDGTSLYNAGSNGYFWSSGPYSDYRNLSWGLYFLSGYHDADSSYRYDGFSVRPVQGFTE